MNATRIVSVAVAPVALAVAAVLMLAQREVDRCQAAREASVQAVRSGAKRPIEEAVDDLVADCPGSDTAARAAAVFTKVEPRLALKLARTATRREPDAYLGWAALAVSARRSDPALARRAWARALALNPRAGVGP